MSGVRRADDGHSGEQLQDLLDGRLDAAVAADVRRHLDSCEQCTAEWHRLRTGRAAAASLRVSHALPDDFEAAVRARLAATHLDDDAGARRWVGDRRMWLAAAATAVAAVATAVWRRRDGDRTIPDDVLRNYANVVSGAAALEHRTGDASTLEAYFASRGLPDVRVLDLAMMGFTLAGARVDSIAGTPAAVYAYRGAGDTLLVCQMYRGTVDSLPPADSVRRQNGFAFHQFRRGAVTAVFWQEGAIVCVLTAELPGDEVFELAAEKAMLPA